MTETDTNGLTWVHRSNQRHIGNSEFRRIVMQIGSGPYARRLEIAFLRASDRQVARTLCCVLNPVELRNINYVTTEYLGRLEPFEILLYLPFGQGSLLNLATERRVEGLLGSGFVYEDLKTWLYEEGHAYSDAVVKGGNLRIPGRCVDRQRLVKQGGNPFDIILEEASMFVTGIDYYDECGEHLVRQYQVESARDIDGIRVAEKMVMRDIQRECVTTISLKDCVYNLSINMDIFEPHFRKKTYIQLNKL